MDGTLLPALSQTMSERTGRSLLAAQAAGITVAIATGRRLAYTVPLIEDLRLRADTDVYKRQMQMRAATTSANTRYASALPGALCAPATPGAAMAKAMHAMASDVHSFMPPT